MSNKKAIAYYRVSTQRQGRSGLGLDAQRAAVRGFTATGAWDLIDEYTEIESGKRSDRPQLTAALAACRLRGATLIIAKLDRTQFTFYPAATTFSDHIVLTIPMENEFSGPSKSAAAMAPFLMLNSLCNIVASIAAEALQIGLLIRGGITIGKVFHSEQIVLGPALVEAYELESKMAIYPRVVLSDELCAIRHLLSDPLVLTDTDGARHLNYFRMAWVKGRSRYGDGWPKTIAELADAKIAELTARHDLNARAKWAWFKGRFTEAHIPLAGENSPADMGEIDPED